MRARRRTIVAAALAFTAACSPAPRSARPGPAGPAAADEAEALEGALEHLETALAVEAASPEAKRDLVARLAGHADLLRRSCAEFPSPAAERLYLVRTRAVLRLQDLVIEEMPADAPEEGPEGGPEAEPGDGEEAGEVEGAAEEVEWPGLSPAAEDALAALVALALPGSFATLDGVPIWDELVGDLASDDAGVRVAAFDDYVSGGRATRALLKFALAASGGRLRSSISVGAGSVPAGGEVRYSHRHRMEGGAGWVAFPAPEPVVRTNPCANTYQLAGDGDVETAGGAGAYADRPGEDGHLMERWALFLDGDSLASVAARAEAASPGVLEIALGGAPPGVDPTAGEVTLPDGDAEAWAVAPAPVAGSTVEVPVLPGEADLGAPSGGLAVEVVEFTWSEEDDGGLWPELIVRVLVLDDRRHVIWMPVALIPGPFCYVVMTEDGVFAGTSDPQTRTLVTERGGRPVPGTVVLGEGGPESVEGFCLLPDLPDGRYVAYVGLGRFALDPANPAKLPDLWTGLAWARPFPFEVATPETVELEEE